MTITQAREPGDLTPGPQHRALLLDFDGTLVDSQQVNYECLADALRGAGIALDQGWFDARTGVSTTEMVRMLAVEQGRDVDPEAVTTARNAAYLSRVDDVREFSPVADLLRSTRGTHRAALATGGQRETIMPTVQALGLDRLLDAVVTRDDVDRGKPEPDIFLAAAARLGLPPAQCLVLEDSDEGLEAARRAGCDAIDVRPLRTAASAA